MRVQKHLARLLMILLFVCSLPGISVADTKPGVGVSPYLFHHNEGEEIHGNSTETGSFFVITGTRSLAQKSYLKIAQSKGVMNTGKSYSSNATGTRRMYEVYTVTMETMEATGVVQSERLRFDGSSIELELDFNALYRITIEPLYPHWVKQMEDVSGFAIYHFDHNPYAKPYDEDRPLFFRIFDSVMKDTWMPLGWEEPSEWHVSGTKGIESCTVTEPVVVSETPIEPAVNDPGYDEDLPIVSLANAATGDTVVFGRYEQGDESTRQDIEWLVLERQDSRLFLISKYILAAMKFQTDDREVSWENSAIRQWLNGAFYWDAFSESERAMIQETNVEAHRNPTYNAADPGKDVSDRIFLLSIQEVRRYFSNDYARLCRLTDGDQLYGKWWLRSCGRESALRAYVRDDGREITAGHFANTSKFGVRPAMWIDTAVAASTPAVEVGQGESSVPEPPQDPPENDRDHSVACAWSDDGVDGFHDAGKYAFFADENGYRIPLGYGDHTDPEENFVVGNAWEIVANTEDTEEYGFYDIDQDGRKELIIKVGTCEADYMYEVYAYREESGFLEYVGHFYAWHSVLLDGNGTLINEMAGMGDYDFFRITLKNGSVTEEKIYSYTASDYDDYPSFGREYDTVYMCTKNIYHCYNPGA